jgi:hypothetical protein
MEKFKFKMYYAGQGGENHTVFFEASFEAHSMSVAQKFGDELAKLYQQQGLVNEAYKVYSHSVDRAGLISVRDCSGKPFA